MANFPLLKAASLGISIVRSLNYSAQGALLPAIDRIIGTPRKRKIKDYAKNLRVTRPKAEAVLKRDAENISSGLYPIQVLFDEGPIEHYSRIPLLLKDALRAGQQKKDRQAHVFAKSESSFVDEAPEYYRRNFHFQDGGYLSATSARLYDHQVEILFSGTAQAMRRQLIPLLKNHFKSSDGRGLRFLEVGSGTGSLTRAVALAFPEANIVCLDPSPHYLQFARNHLKRFKRLSFLQGYGEKLDFKDETFDAVFSCFLFHELPEKVRHEVISEKHRVLKKGGILALADSIQKNDDPDLNWALDNFPVDFHEPFYKNFVEKPLEDILRSVCGNIKASEVHFLTKVLASEKN